MKLTTGILAMAMMVGGSAATNAVAQNTDAIDNARSTAKSLQQKQDYLYQRDFRLIMHRQRTRYFGVHAIQRVSPCSPTQREFALPPSNNS